MFEKIKPKIRENVFFRFDGDRILIPYSPNKQDGFVKACVPRELAFNILHENCMSYKRFGKFYRYVHAPIRMPDRWA